MANIDNIQLLTKKYILTILACIKCYVTDSTINENSVNEFVVLGVV